MSFWYWKYVLLVTHLVITTKEEEQNKTLHTYSRPENAEVGAEKKNNNNVNQLTSNVFFRARVEK